MNPQDGWSTGNPQLDFVLGIILAGLVWYLFRVYQLKRQTIHETLRALCLGALFFGAAYYLLPQMGMEKNLAVVVGVFGSAVIYGRRKQPSRHIPRALKRAVIARDLKGEAYDSAKHHLDHHYPFSRGGDTSKENLRVISKEENLKKGAKVPRFWDL